MSMLVKLFGASWKTSLVGYIGIASGIAGFIGDLIVTQGLPQTLPEYFVFGGLVLGGIAHILSKDKDVSNSQHPAAPTEVSAVNTEKPNASAVK